METIKGKTDTGFKFEIDSSVGDDWELLELISQVETNPLIIIKVLNKMFDQDQVDKLKEHVRDENGFVSTAKLMSEVTNIFTKAGELKN